MWHNPTLFCNIIIALIEFFISPVEGQILLKDSPLFEPCRITNANELEQKMQVFVRELMNENWIKMNQVFSQLVEQERKILEATFIEKLTGSRVTQLENFASRIERSINDSVEGFAEKQRLLYSNFTKIIHDDEDIINSIEVLKNKTSDLFESTKNIGYAQKCATEEINCTCPSNWKENQGSCYQWFSSKVNWFEAQMTCRTHDANLVQVDSASENAWLVKNFNSEIIWIGGTDLAKEGKWRWSASGDEMKYSNWYQNEPSNHGNNENCVQFNFNGVSENAIGQWNDIKCTNTFSFICEKSSC